MIMQSLAVRDDAPRLRLIAAEPTDADDFTGGLSPTMRLSEFFDAVYLPWLRGKLSAPETILLYQETIKHWRRITGDPPLCEITDDTCAAFVEGLAALPGRRGPTLASHTIFRHCNHVQWVLDRTGPRVANDRKQRRNRGLLDDVPIVERPKLDVLPPDGDFTLAETVRLLAAFASRPPRAPRAKDTGVAPGTWWRALIACLYYSGLRIGAAMQLEWTMLDGDYLVIPARVMKQRKGKRQFLHAEAREAIERLRGGQELIFAYPNWTTKSGARRSMRRVFERMLEVAGLPEHRRFGFHGFRKAHASQLALANPLAAQLSLGHESAKTTNEHYVNHRVAAAAIQQLPSLRAAAREGDTKQKRLFE